MTRDQLAVVRLAFGYLQASASCGDGGTAQKLAEKACEKIDALLDGEDNIGTWRDLKDFWADGPRNL